MIQSQVLKKKKNQKSHTTYNLPIQLLKSYCTDPIYNTMYKMCDYLPLAKVQQQ